MSRECFGRTLLLLFELNIFFLRIFQLDSAARCKYEKVRGILIEPMAFKLYPFMVDSDFVSYSCLTAYWRFNWKLVKEANKNRIIDSSIGFLFKLAVNTIVLVFKTVSSFLNNPSIETSESVKDLSCESFVGAKRIQERWQCVRS